MRLQHKLRELRCMVVGFGFGVFTACLFFPEKSTFWLRFIAGGLITAGMLLAVAGKRSDHKDIVDDLPDA